MKRFIKGFSRQTSVASSTTVAPYTGRPLTSLPVEIFEQILAYVAYSVSQLHDDDRLYALHQQFRICKIWSQLFHTNFQVRRYRYWHTYIVFLDKYSFRRNPLNGPAVAPDGNSRIDIYHHDLLFPANFRLMLTAYSGGVLIVPAKTSLDFVKYPHNFQRWRREEAMGWTTDPETRDGIMKDKLFALFIVDGDSGGVNPPRNEFAHTVLKRDTPIPPSPRVVRAADVANMSDEEKQEVFERLRRYAGAIEIGMWPAWDKKTEKYHDGVRTELVPRHLCHIMEEILGSLGVLKLEKWLDVTVEQYLMWIRSRVKVYNQWPRKSNGAIWVEARSQFVSRTGTGTELRFLTAQYKPGTVDGSKM